MLHLILHVCVYVWVGERAILLLVINILLLASPEHDRNTRSEKKRRVNAFKRGLENIAMM